MNTKIITCIKNENNKAWIKIGSDIILISYLEPVCIKKIIPCSEAVRFKTEYILSSSWDYSRTTLKHLKEFTGLSKKEILDKIKKGDIRVVQEFNL